jgi:hypothetical protein
MASDQHAKRIGRTNAAPSRATRSCWSRIRRSAGNRRTTAEESFLSVSGRPLPPMPI